MRKKITCVEVAVSILIMIGISPSHIMAQDCIESSIVKPTPFMGNHGEIFTLADGSLWEIRHEYEYLYEYYPSVIVCPSRGKLFIGDKSLDIKRVSSGINPSSDGIGSEWVLVEETSVPSTISGIVQQGHIFKTLSGNIYEVTGITIQVVVAVYPSVTVLRNGNTYKLIVESFDEPLICRKLK